MISFTSPGLTYNSLAGEENIGDEVKDEN